jgi:hypothetical protein
MTAQRRALENRIVVDEQCGLDLDRLCALDLVEFCNIVWRNSLLAAS